MKKLLFALAIGIAASTQNLHAQAHGHLNVGGGDIQGTQLFFENGDIFKTNSGYVMTLNYTNAGVYAGYYQGNITLTALGGTDPFPCAPGSLIYAQLVSVDGPEGGVFSFWNTTAGPTISLPSGTTGTNIFKLSENDGSPSSNPHGHYHGRRFTATKPGLYVVGFRALDLCTNGVSGGPIQTPSDVIKIYFQAGVTITSLANSNATAAVTFAAPGGKTCSLQYSDTVGGTNWNDVDSLVGDDYLHTLTDLNPTNSQRFYRIEVQ